MIVITVARKPVFGTVASNVAEWGAGGLNIDGCRIATNPVLDDPRLGGAGSWGTQNAAKNIYSGGYAGERVGSSSLGRWPANVILSQAPSVLTAFPPAGAFAPVRGTEASVASTGNVTGKRDRVPGAFHSDIGTAARFFKQVQE